MQKLFVQVGNGLWLLLAAVLTLIAGCADSGDGYHGPRGEVQGTITFQGDPVPQGSTVLFQSTDEGATYLAVGTILADGTYQLSSSGNRQLPGVTYAVQITPPPNEDLQREIDAADSEEEDPQAKIKAAEEFAKANPPPFPAKYSSIMTSELKFTVEPGLNVADFDLEE